MKLNELQAKALLVWLGGKMPYLYTNHSAIYQYNQFCNGEITEWCIICTFGMAGKIWNVYDKIYITGFSPQEIGKRQYNKQQKLIEKWNKEIEDLLVLYFE